jgi:hypothetical protein
VQLLLGYWFYNYLIWFYPLLLVAVIQPPRRHRDAKTLANSTREIDVPDEVRMPLVAAAETIGVAHRVIRHGPVRSLAEAARVRGVAPADVVKTLVVRRGEDDFLFVLVPGDRVRGGHLRPGGSNVGRQPASARVTRSWCWKRSGAGRARPVTGDPPCLLLR